MKPIIEVHNLVKRYHKAHKNAVDSISFSVAPGEFFSFLGPNGAGKTTTISILTTTLSKTSGDVTIAGFDIEKQASLVRQNVGIIFQNPSLDLNLTAEENVRFHSILYGIYPFSPFFELMPKAYQKRVKDLAEILGLGDEIFKPIKTFSGGMKRKLEIIRSLMHKPKVLFLDEPTIGLDPLSRKDLWEYLRKVRHEEGMTIFLTTHYLEEAEQADTICIINKGKIVAHGSPEEIKNNLVEEYLLIDAKNKTRLRDELEKKKISFSEDSFFKLPVTQKNVQKTIQKIDTPLSMLETHLPSLEDAYLSIVEDKKEEEHART